MLFRSSIANTRPDAAVTTVTFEEQDGQTLLVLHERYPTKEALDEITYARSKGQPVYGEVLAGAHNAIIASVKSAKATFHAPPCIASWLLREERLMIVVCSLLRPRIRTHPPSG